MNKTIFTGNLTRDPEMHQTQSGKSVARFTIAVSRGYKSDEADFIPIAAWNQLGEIVMNGVKKGQKVLVEGRLRVSTYDEDGTRRYRTEVVADSVEYFEKRHKAEDASSEKAAPEGEPPLPEPGMEPEEDVPF